MRTFAINTLGCKVNQYESQQIRQLLEDFHLQETDISLNPDLLVVNTCCVTHIASAKSRQTIRKVRKFNPDSVIVVTGCLPAGPVSEIQGLSEDIELISDKAKLLESLTAIVNKHTGTDSDKSLYQKDLTKPNHDDSMPSLDRYSGQSRAFLKVQDGCDGYCAYCIVPKIRRKIYNKPVKNVINEARQLVYAGHKEIVLTGIFLGAYGQTTVRRKKWDPDKLDSLAHMLEKVAKIKGLERIRLSSLEPADVTDRLLNVMRNNHNIMPHLHLPLQSGSAKILKKMGRQYTIDDFKETISKVKARIDHPAITTDIIVGFPTESEENFQETLEISRESGFSKIHVFSYSERKNTAAVNIMPKVDTETIKKRSKTLRDLDAELGKKFRTQFVGQPVSAVIEDHAKCKGRCERYFMVQFDCDAEKCEKGRIVSGILNKDAITADAKI